MRLHNVAVNVVTAWEDPVKLKVGVPGPTVYIREISVSWRRGGICSTMFSNTKA
jgi:hypothetical protein